MNKIHEIKTWPEPFEAIIKGLKSFDVRVNDRDYQVDDLLYHKEFKPCPECGGGGRVWDVGDMIGCGCPEPHGEYTGRTAVTGVKYVQPGGKFGLNDGYVAMSIFLMMYDDPAPESTPGQGAENES